MADLGSDKDISWIGFGSRIPYEFFAKLYIQDQSGMITWEFPFPVDIGGNRGSGLPVRRENVEQSTERLRQFNARNFR